MHTGVCCESADKNSLNLTFIYALNIERPFFVFFFFFLLTSSEQHFGVEWRVPSLPCSWLCTRQLASCPCEPSLLVVCSCADHLGYVHLKVSCTHTEGGREAVVSSLPHFFPLLQILPRGTSEEWLFSPFFSWNGHYPWHCKLCRENRVHAAYYLRLFFGLQLISTIILWTSRNFFPSTLKPYIHFVDKKAVAQEALLSAGGKKEDPSICCLFPLYLHGKGQNLNEWARCKEYVNSCGLLWLDVILQIKSSPSLW